jgi:acyl-CoA synthetase (AMP-forming)/AMP-acid ligase II
MELNDILYLIHEGGVVLYSSGTTGEPKKLPQMPKKIRGASVVARQVQGIKPDSKIYTVMSLNHAGGLLGQVMPALEIEAYVYVEKFNPYTFIKEINKYTHTHITPAHAKAIMKTKGFWNLDLTGITITCGSEPVTWDIIEAFVGRGCKFIVNWGMTEIGPIAINHAFTSIDEVNRVKSFAPANSTVMGSVKYCQYKIENGELVVKGDICIYKDWFHTGDLVSEVNGFLFYHGRVNKEVDFDNPTKGL